MKLIYFIIFLLCYAFQSEAQLPVLHHFDEDGIHLRWPGDRSAELEGYNIYRKSSTDNNFVKQNSSPVKAILNSAQITAILGSRKKILYGLLNIENINQNISQGDVSRAANNADGGKFFEAICMVNPDFATVLGEIYLDPMTTTSERTYVYRINAIVGGKEVIVAESESINLNSYSSLPQVEGISFQSEDQGILLSWPKEVEAMSNGSIVAYRVFRASTESGPYQPLMAHNQLEVKLGEGNSNKQQASYKDSFLENGKLYYYRVKAVNAFGIEGPFSETIKAIPGDSPTPPQRLESSSLGTAIIINWEIRNNSSKYTRVYKSDRKNGPYKLVHASPAQKGKNKWIDPNTASGTELFYYLSSEGHTGQIGAPSDTIRVFFEDKIKPNSPIKLKATSEEGKVKLSWQKNSESDLLGYEVMRSTDSIFSSEFLLTDNPITKNNYVDILPKESQATYYYRINAIDKSYNRSAPSKVISARLPDRTAPQAPFITQLQQIGDSLFVKWSACAESDVSYYELEWATEETEFAVLNSSSDLDFSFIPVQNGVYRFRIHAVDFSGNKSLPSSELKIKYKLKNTESPITNLSVNKEGRNLKIQWEVDEQKVESLLLSRLELETGELVDIAETGSKSRGFLDLYADPNAQYIYQLRYFDFDGVISEAITVEYSPQ